jgi:hypothetical protein
MLAFMVVRKGTLVVTGSFGDGISMSGGCKEHWGFIRMSALFFEI